MMWAKRKSTTTVWVGILIAFSVASLAFTAGEGIAAQQEKHGTQRPFEYVIDDFTVYPIPEIPKPAKGKPFRDPTFHTEIVRISDRKQDKLTAWGKTLGMILNEYARVDPENCDGSRAVFKSPKDSGRWFVYDLDTFEMIVDIYKQARDKKLVIGELEPRWDRYDPNVFYFSQKGALFKYDISNKKIEMVRDFKKDFGEDVYYLRNRYEGRPSFDSRYWAFRADGGRSRGWKTLAWVWYDLRENTILGSRQDPPGSDHVSMGMFGNFFCVGTMGHVAYNLEDFQAGKVSIKLSPTTTHADLAITAEGREAMVYQNGKNDWIEMTYLDTGQTVKLISYTHKTTWDEMLKGGAGLHISGLSIGTPGWVLVSWYGGAPRKPFSWQHQALFMLELKENPRVWRVAHTHCPWAEATAKDYWAEAFAAINAAGTRVYWGSNWDEAEKETRTIEVYSANLPETWYSDLMGRENAEEARRATRKQIEEKLGSRAAEAYDKLLARSAN